MKEQKDKINLENKQEIRGAVCIYTVYNTENCGSFLQAYALQTIIRRMGYDACFSSTIKEKNPTHTLKNTITVALKRFLKLRWVEGFREIEKYYKFEKAQRAFLKIDDDSHLKLKPVSAVVVGSDTVWNLDSSFFKKNICTYFAQNWEGYNRCTYAVSVANTSLEEFEQTNSICEMMSGFENISVRDEKTALIVKALIGVEPARVCDPTMLLTCDDYDELLRKPLEEPYIFIYAFEGFSLSLKKKIMEFSKKEKLKIVTLGHYRDSTWLQSQNICPDNFITLMKYASYVITDTFHGTVFSMIYNKQFVVIEQGKNKVREVLDKYGLGSRLCTCNSIDSVISQRIDYSVVNKSMIRDRNFSLSYLRDALGGNR